MKIRNALLMTVSLTAFLATCARNGNGYHDVKPPPPPPPPPIPVQLLISVENSAMTTGHFDAFESMITGWRQQLSAAQVPYYLVFFRSTENPDGNYDTGPQGSTPVVAFNDTDAAGEVHAELRAIQGAPLGSKPLPLEILSHVIADPRSTVGEGIRNVLISFYCQSAENWQGNGLRSEARDFYLSFFNATFGANSWRALSVLVPGCGPVDALFAQLNLGDNVPGYSPEDFGRRIIDWSYFPDQGR